MPELPEVETSRRAVEKALMGKRLIEVIPDFADRIVYDDASPKKFRRAIEGASVTGTGRKGKYFWLELDRRPWPVFHLGMSGNVEMRMGRGQAWVKAWGGYKRWHKDEGIEGQKPVTMSKPANAANPPISLPYCRLRLVADDGVEIAITDPRRFGRIRLAEDPLLEPPISLLGFDPLLAEFPTAKRWSEILGRRKAPIKAVLLDQSLFAGVGNWIADEVLFRARISPRRLAQSLEPPEVAKLRSAIIAVVGKSVAVGADYDRYPRSWLFHNRWGKQTDAQVWGRQRIVHETIGGRTTAWVPELQK